MGNCNVGKDNKCPICGKENITIERDSIEDKYLCYTCPNCGEFFAPKIDYDEFIAFPRLYPNFRYNVNHLKSFLFYHKINETAFLMSAKEYENFDQSKYGNIYNLTSDMVENWYPKNLKAQIDLILICLIRRQEYFGHRMKFEYADLNYIFFVNAQNINPDSRINDECKNQIDYILNYLENLGYIEFSSVSPINFYRWSHPFFITFTPAGLARIEELQKNEVYNKNVFVAMKFGEETKALREKIKEGLEGYNVRIMDEIEHNHQIVPEMLYEIRNSKFIIAELSNHNNGAYYEAGYALGLGKEVIHICQKNEMTNGLHFDVAQVNTIVYENIEEIPEKLKKRIQATIK